MEKKMEKKYIRKPFDVEMAKKIQSGEIEGRIVTEIGTILHIITFDFKKKGYPILAYSERIDGNINIHFISEVGFQKSLNCCGYVDAVHMLPNFEVIKNDSQLLYIELPEEEPNPIYSKEQCVYGKDSKMKCDFCSALCKERAEDFAKRRIKVSIIGEKPKHEFKPFDQVLVRKNDDDNQYWQPKTYLFFHPAFKEHVTTDGMMYEIVLPYEGNEKLVGTITEIEL